MKIRQIVSLFLVIIMVAVLGGCASSSVAFEIDDNGAFMYSIVRNGESTTLITDAARELRSSIKDNFNCKVTLIKDNAVEDFDENYEILIGNTNREESAFALEKLKNNRANYADDFIVVVIDDKICIQAITDEMVLNAAKWFASTFCNSEESWSKLTKKYCFIYEFPYDGAVSTIGNKAVGAYSIVMPRQISYLIGMNAEKIAKYYADKGFNMEIFEDMDEEKEYEIIIGDSTREASKSVKVEGDNYVIKVVGKKVIIKGGNDLATWRATKYFYDEIVNSEKGETGFDWSDGYVINGKYDATEENAYTLNWNDEFEGSDIDYTKWGDYRNESTTGVWEASCLGGMAYWQDLWGDTYDPQKWNQRDLSYVSDGALHLGTAYIREKDFMGAQISTYWTMIFRYGLLEIRADLGETPAATSLWFNGASTGTSSFEERFGQQQRVAMTEFDILENFGYNHYYASTVHRWWTNYDVTGVTNGSGHTSMDGNALYGPNSGNSKKLMYNTEKYGDMLTSDYRIFSMYWDEYGVTFAFDGRKYCYYDFADNQSVSIHCLMNYIIMRCRMGGSTYGVTYEKEKHPQYCETMVDYVRVYQSDKDNSQMITAWPQKQEKGTATIFYPENNNGTTY